MSFFLADVLLFAGRLYDRRVDASGDPGLVGPLSDWPKLSPASWLNSFPTWAAWGDGTLWRCHLSPARIECGARTPKVSGWCVFVYESPTWTQLLPGEFRAPLWAAAPDGSPVDLDGLAERAAVLEVDREDRRTGRERFLRSADLSREHVARTGGRPCEVCGLEVVAGARYVERVMRQGKDNRRAHPACVAQAWTRYPGGAHVPGIGQTYGEQETEVLA